MSALPSDDEYSENNDVAIDSLSLDYYGYKILSKSFDKNPMTRVTTYNSGVERGFFPKNSQLTLFKKEQVAQGSN
jgi:hypothetical protein